MIKPKVKLCTTNHRTSIIKDEFFIKEICVADADAISHLDSFVELICWRTYCGEDGVKMITIKYFVHGTTTDNLEKKASGWLDGQLSEKGKEQAKALAETIKNEHFDVVFCSDLKRAVDSASIDFYGRNIKIIKDARLRECNYGDYNGLDSKLAHYPSHIIDKFPNGESMIDIETRIKDFITFLKQNYNNKKIAIVAHKAPQLALDVIIKNMTWEEALANDWRLTGNWQPGWEYHLN